MRAVIRKSSLREALAVLAISIVAPALGGCGEINDMLDAGAGKDKEKPAASSASTASSGQSAKEKLAEYYNRESRAVEQDPGDPIVSCRIKGRRQFMRRSDCFLRGGSAT